MHDTQRTQLTNFNNKNNIQNVANKWCKSLKVWTAELNRFNQYLWATGSDGVLPERTTSTPLYSLISVRIFLMPIILSSTSCDLSFFNIVSATSIMAG